jgi:hypothetical protein
MPSLLSSFRKRLKTFAIFVLVYALSSFHLQHKNAISLQERQEKQESESLLQRNAPLPHRALLRSILDFETGEITGDPQFLLDFAIIGFPKCGTTSFQVWLGQHPQVQCFENEVFALSNNLPERLIFRLYTKLKPESHWKRGFKNPLDIRTPHSLQYLQSLFPKTLLIVGIRHPVLWFES